MRILAIDIGASKALVGRFAWDGDRLETAGERRRYPSRSFASLDALLERVREDDPAPVDAVALGVPGPILDGRVEPVNLDWPATTIGDVARACGTERVRLLNDLEALANAVRHPADLTCATLLSGVDRPGHIGLVAPGTGLGLAYLHHDGRALRPVATEGGHTHFGPRDAREIALLRFLLDDPALGGHVSYERVASGLGLDNLYRFLVEVEGRVPAGDVARDVARLAPHERAARIGAASADGSCAVCRDVIDWFVTLVAAQAANQALVVMALGGVYIGGGIVVRHLDRFQASFADAFVAKGRYRELMQQIPVRAILNDDAALVGAARAATETGP